MKSSDADVVSSGPSDEKSTAHRLWLTIWPKVAAVLIAFGGWQLVVSLGVWPPWVLPPPLAVLQRLGTEASSGAIITSLAITGQRAAVGFVLAVALGAGLGAALTSSRTLRVAIMPMLTGLQTMPSVAWFPLAISIFQLSEASILAVVVLGATPSVAVAMVSSRDQVPPLWIRAGQSLGARGLKLYRYVILPAMLPGLVAGLKQAWAFAWRSLMAGELLVIIGHHASLGVRLAYARELSDAEGLLAWMLVILAVGVVVDSTVFSSIESTMNRRRGLAAG